MSHIQKLLDLAQQEGIHVSYDRELYTEKHPVRGLYFVDHERCTAFIVLDESLKSNPSLHASVLAEELGHHFSGVSGSFMDTGKDAFKNEIKALRWAVQFLATA